MSELIVADRLRRTFHVSHRAGLLRRKRTEVVAVDAVDFTVQRGEAVGYVGPNGAGKSTTIKMLTGILVPSSGTARVCGLDPARQRRALAARIGVVFGQRSQLWWDLPLSESFELLRSIHRVPRADYRKRLDECVELLELTPFLATPVRQLSLGQRMRGEVTAALLHDPELLVLDEPTIGLDLTRPHEPLTGLPGVHEVRTELDGLRQHLVFGRAETTAAALISAVVARVAVHDVFVVEPEIEEVIRRLYSR